jgi:hypothetical protein
MKVKFGAIVVDGRGKLGGHVFAKNRGGNYMRTKVTPVNPQTARQTAVRSLFGAIASAWSSLTQTQRDSFGGLVEAYSSTNIFGDIKSPSAIALHQKLNFNLGNSGQAQITTALAPIAVPNSAVTDAEYEVGSTAFFVNYAGDTTGSKVLIFATTSLSQGTKFVKDKLRQIGVVDGSASGDYDAYALYNAKFGVPAIGANIYVGVKTVNGQGQASPLEVVKISVIA